MASYMYENQRFLEYLYQHLEMQERPKKEKRFNDQDVATVIDKWNQANPFEMIRKSDNLWVDMNPIAELCENEWGDEDWIYMDDLTSACCLLAGGRKLKTSIFD